MDKGTPIDNLSNYNSSEENLVYIAPMADIRQKKLLFGTKTAMLKLVSGAEFDVAKRTTAATKLNEGDMVLFVHPVAESDHIVMQSAKGMRFLRIEAGTFNPSGKRKKGAVGVRGMRLASGDQLEAIYLLREEDEPVSVRIKYKEVALNSSACGEPGHQRSKAMKKTILFDLDGTLVDSGPGITKCAQYALDHFGIHEPETEKLAFFVGPPLMNTFMEHYGFSEEQAKQGSCKIPGTLPQDRNLRV